MRRMRWGRNRGRRTRYDIDGRGRLSKRGKNKSKQRKPRNRELDIIGRASCVEEHHDNSVHSQISQMWGEGDVTLETPADHAFIGGFAGGISFTILFETHTTSTTIIPFSTDRHINSLVPIGIHDFEVDLERLIWIVGHL